MLALNLLRLAFLLTAAAGAILAIAYPYAIGNLGGYEIGRHPVYSADEGFRTVTVRLGETEALVRVEVELVARQSANATETAFALDMVVLRDGETYMRGPIEFSDPAPADGNVQSGRLIYRARTIIDPVLPGEYVFAFEPTAAMGFEPESATLLLTAPAIEWDARVQPIGYVLLVIGIVGLVISIARPGRQRPAGTPRPRWGRGGKPE